MANGNAGGNETNKNANAGATGTNNNANLKKLNVNANTTNKGMFVTAFNAAAEIASGTRFPEIAEKCTILANTLGSDTNIDLGSKFGNYGNSRAANQTASANLNKVKAFTGSENAPTRGAILIKILQEIKDLVKKRRNSNSKLSGNIKTAENFNKAIISLINAVNKARKENAPTPGNEQVAQQGAS